MNERSAGKRLRLFEESIQAGALKLAVILSSNMAFPRKTVFEIIEYVRQNIINAFAEGVKDVIFPVIDESRDKKLVDAFIQLCESTFCNVETESKLDNTLTLENVDLLNPIRKYPIGVKNPSNEEDRCVS